MGLALKASPSRAPGFAGDFGEYRAADQLRTLRPLETEGFKRTLHDFCTELARLTMNPKPKIAEKTTTPATDEARAPASAALLTPAELAARLAVGESWVREKTRERARLRDRDPLPCVRLGKYVRFSWAAVEAWLQRQGA
jgi:predicted DNA-binding transcriptional regulator AlpA